MSYSTDSFYISDDNKAYIKSKVEQEKTKGNRRFNKSNFIDDLLTHLRTKSESKPKPPAVKQEMQYPPQLNIEAWNEWKAYRRENKMKAYKPSARSEGVAVNNLIKLSKGDHHTQLLIVQQSMANGYQGLFEVKTNEANKSGNDQAGRNSSEERVNSALEKQRAEFFSGSEVMESNDPLLHDEMGNQERGGSFIELDNGDWSSN